MKLHLVSLPHTRVEQKFSHCAYTQKVLKFAKMVGALYSICVYAPAGAPITGAELVPCLTDERRQEIFGRDDQHKLPEWPTDAQTAEFNQNVISSIRSRYNVGDLILLSGGRTHLAVAQAFPDAIVCEPGIGYFGICPTTHCCFESYAHMHQVYAKNGIEDVRWFDCVIPNYFDVAEFPNINQGKGDYLMFLGRLIPRKGPHIAAEIADACGMDLVVAGAGAVGYNQNLIACAGDYNIRGKQLRYVGPVGIEERSKLLAGARALIVPTTYFEPFGGVAVEAMMAGTPVITTDAGAFTETVRDGVNGFKFHTLAEGVDAVEKCKKLNPLVIRAQAKMKYSLEAVAPQFDRWFKRLATLWGKGWYEVASTPKP